MERIWRAPAWCYPVRLNSAFDGREHHLFRAPRTPVGGALSGGGHSSGEVDQPESLQQSYPYTIAPSYGHLIEQ